MTYKAVLFDVDGTLVDNVNICTAAYRETLLRCTGRRYEDEEITRHYGKTEEGILAVYVGPAELPGVVETYFAVYSDLHRAVPAPFPGMHELLSGLQGQVKLGVVTGKSLRLAEVTLRELGLLDYFLVIEGGFVDRADKAESLRRAAGRLGLPAHQILYVGDTDYDLNSAAAAGIAVVGAAWSESTTITPENARPALQVFHRLEDFSVWLAGQLD